MLDRLNLTAVTSMSYHRQSDISTCLRQYQLPSPLWGIQDGEDRQQSNGLPS